MKNEDNHVGEIVQTVTLFGGEWSDGIWEFGNNTRHQSHFLTFTTNNGKIDCPTAKIQEIEGK